MPPKAKFTKEQIANAAFEIIRNKSPEALTARNLAKEMGSSACPIFTVFNNMDEVLFEATKRAKALYATYIQRGLSDKIPFKGVGKQYIQFAKDEPKLFQLLFMTEMDIGGIDHFLPVIDDNYSLILQSVKSSYGLNDADANDIYTHLTIYTHGIATLIARKVVSFTEENIDKMLTDVFVGLLKEIKGKKHD